MSVYGGLKSRPINSSTSLYGSHFNRNVVLKAAIDRINVGIDVDGNCKIMRSYVEVRIAGLIRNWLPLA